MVLVSVVLSLLSGLCIAAEPAQGHDKVVTYGELLILDESEPNLPNNRISMSAGFDSGNALLDIYNFSLGYNYNFLNFFELGVLARSFSSSKSALLKSVEDNFGLLGVEINAEQPKYSYYITFTIIPLKGRLNFFSYKVLLYELAILLGPGQRVTLRDEYWGYFFSIQSRVTLTDQFGVIFSYDHEAESAFSSRENVARNQLNLGISYAF